jgi:hypothetical protein
MVGQAMRSKEREYRYYGCRHAYDRRTGHECSSRLVRADRLEAIVWGELGRILASPEVILNEMGKEGVEAGRAERERLERAIESLKQRERRLVRLFSLGELDEEAIAGESAHLRRERMSLEAQLPEAPIQSAPKLSLADQTVIAAACRAVGDRLNQAGEGERRLVLEACQVVVEATREHVKISGVLPVQVPEFFSEQHASA